MRTRRMTERRTATRRRRRGEARRPQRAGSPSATWRAPPNVSIGTVSKALNNSGSLRQETRDQVIAVAKELGFRPNDLAQSLHRGQTFTVGLISTDTFGRFTIPIMEGLEECLADSRISVFMCNATDDPEREAQHVDSLLGKRVDGIVVTGRRADRRARLDVHGPRHPGALRLSRSRTSRMPSASCPTTRAAPSLAVEHLARLGRRRIAHVTGPERFEAVRLRRDGYRKTLAAARPRRAGRLLSARRLVGGLGPRGGRAALRAAGAPPPDAIFCGNDQIARGVADALRERGIAVPDAVSIVGFDNWEIIAEATRPPLTTVDMNLKELGREAGRRLIELIAGERLDGVRRLPCSLVVREFVRRAAAWRRDGLNASRRQGGASRCVRFTPVNFTDVSIEGDFWRERLDTVLTRTIPSQHEQLGRTRHPRIRSSVPQPPPPLRIPRNHAQLHHADLLGLRRRQMDRGGELRARAPARRGRSRRRSTRSPSELAKAQLPDGYLNCWYIGREIDKRWTNLRDNHELYCAGHMLEGAIAYFQATGRRRLLDIMLRYVDHIATRLRTGRGPEARLLRAPGDRARADQALPRSPASRKHLDLATYFINERGGSRRTISTSRRVARGDDPKNFWAKTYEYNQSHKPVREQDKVVGHAVRAMYMYTAMADLAAELGDDAAEARLRGAVEGRDLEADVRDGRARPGGRERGLHRRLRPAERHRLRGDLRLGRADLLGAAHAQPRARRPLCRRDGAGALQRRALRPRRATARTISTRTRSRATAATRAGTGTPARAAR